MLQALVNLKNDFSLFQQDGQWILNDKAAELSIQFLPNGLISVLHNGRSYTAVLEKLDKKNKELSLQINGHSCIVSIKEEIDLLLESMGMGLNASKKAEPVKAPMPGMILRILVTPGQQIKKGEGLLVLEAMKMENVIKATGDATIKAVKVNEHTAVEKGAVLLELE